jgi:exo-beta-1,3-glucanase (GH17 family)/cellulose synthase/poly-beta-1,6-N-acetylglucosamine synthase-like glycosyltransferase
MRTVAAVLALVACVHAGLWASLRTKETAPDFTGQLASVSYSPPTNPESDETPTPEQIRADIKAIAPYAKAIRTYSSTRGAELVPPIAAEFGLKVAVGAWIGKDKDRNKSEIRTALGLARRYGNVNAIYVGNEAVLTNQISADGLIELIREAKRSSPVPVTTGESWDIYIKYPQLASAVDFIAAHILPYWGGVKAAHAADWAIEKYDALRRLNPGKHVVIAEFGWPSAGPNFQGADPGRIDQAMILRDFVARVQAYGIDYNIIEGMDRPWKTVEGGVGPYWGVLDASGHPKFSWTGPITVSDYFKSSGLAVLLGLLLSLPILAISGATLRQSVTLAIAANVAGAWFAAIVAFWNGHYFVWGAAFALGLGVVLVVPLVAIALARIEEIAAIAFGRAPRRLATAPPLAPEGYAPKVSIHVPACCEPPDMLCATLDAVAKVDYPNLECVVIINNTPDPKFWEPVEAHCKTLGDRFKFLRLEKHSGYKAGALRIALEHTAPDAEIIGLIDADYVVEPNWLKDLVPLFVDARVGLVQSPQDHRDSDRSPMHYAMNAEYAGFFDIGMVQRNEANAIIVHGTMCLIRREALMESGNWSSDTIVEDSDLGLTMLEHGWTAHYTNRRYGYGLLPDTYDAFKRQRHRWAFGGLQILRKHWRSLLPWSEDLSREQKREYGLGWLNWLGAESIGVLVALLNIAWVPLVVYGIYSMDDWATAFSYLGISPDRIADSSFLRSLHNFGAVPDRILTVPILAAFVVSVAHFASLYRLRVKASAGQMAGAVCAAMSVQWTVARAVSIGVFKEHLPFLRTSKGGNSRKGTDFPAFAEAVVGALLLTGGCVLIMTNVKQVREINMFAFVLMVQSLPFLAAVAMSLLEGSRLNSFAYWGALEARLARYVEFLPRSKVISNVIVEPQKLPAENSVETVQ